MSITNTGGVLCVTIEVDLGTVEVLVEAHGSRVGCVHPDDREIYYRPSQ
jgi:hypothetical protein